MTSFNHFGDLISLLPKVSMGEANKRTTLSNPRPTLSLLSKAKGKRLTIDDFAFIQPWVIAALAIEGLKNEESKIFVDNQHTSSPSRFAFTLGLDAIIQGVVVPGEAEHGRTVKLTRVAEYEQIESVSEKIAELLISDAPDADRDEYIDADETRKTLRYVMIELLRNVIQHSYSEYGAVIVAQRMDRSPEYSQPFIQIAVADCGTGILESLRETHKDIESAEVALEKSIWPSFSGKFYSGQKGGSQNAGMGLFFVSEMAKLTGGKLLIASRGASLFVQGDVDDSGRNKIEMLKEEFDGTLVAFEIPKRGVADYDNLIKTIQNKARERTHKIESHHWIIFRQPDAYTFEFVVNVISENTVKAEEFLKTELVPRINRKEVIVLNFSQINACTQSYLHALLFEAVKLAFDLKVPLYATNTTGAVKDGIRFVESYSLEE